MALVNPSQPANAPAHFECDYSGSSTTLHHVWEHTIGSGHAPLALRADWQAQMRRCRDELGFRYVRFHGLLCDDMGTFIINCDKPLYSFFNIDQIFDFLVSIGMKPFVELSFMPTALASGNKTAFHYRANVTPPKDYDQWKLLIHTLATHWIARYGIEEVRSWFFEVWNEPNLDAFGSGKQEDYFKLYQSTAEAIKSVDAELRVGGPVTAANAWITDFVSFCKTNKLPSDFISTHHYPTDAFGNPGDDTEAQLAASRRGVLREQALGVVQQAEGKPVYYTEWSSSSNPRDPMHDQPYAAAFAVKTLMEVSGLVEAYSYWTFSDIFEENYFPSMPFHGGFGLMNIHGIPKPIYRAYELLRGLGTELLHIDGTHATVDIWAVSSKNSLILLITNYALPRHPLVTENVQITINNISEPKSATVARIDDDHANARRAWEELGSPDYLDHDQLEALQSASQMGRADQDYKYNNKTVELIVLVPPQGIASVTLSGLKATAGAK